MKYCICGFMHIVYFRKLHSRTILRFFIIVPRCIRNSRLNVLIKNYIHFIRFGLYSFSCVCIGRSGRCRCFKSTSRCHPCSFSSQFLSSMILLRHLQKQKNSKITGTKKCKIIHKLSRSSLSGSVIKILNWIKAIKWAMHQPPNSPNHAGAVVEIFVLFSATE